MKLRELTPLKKPQDYILSEKKEKDGDTMSVRVPWIQADLRNKNGRIYPKALLQREVAKVQKAVESGAFIGTGDHPETGHTDIETASHIVQKLELDENGRGWAELKILPTTRGENIQKIIKAGGQLGISARGFGDVGKDGRVANNYKLEGIDIVISPSFDTTFNKDNIFESVDFETESEEEIRINERFIQKILEMNYSRDIDLGIFSGSLEDYVKEHKAHVTAIDLHLKGHFESVEQALEYLGEHEKAKKISPQGNLDLYDGNIAFYFREALAAGYGGSIEEFKEMIKNTKKRDKSDLASREAILAGGSRTRLVQKMEKYPDGEERIVYVSEQEDLHDAIERARTVKIKTEEEVLDKEAKRIFKIEKATNPDTAVTVEQIKAMLIAEKKRKLEESKKLREDALNRLIKESVSSGKIE